MKSELTKMQDMYTEQKELLDNAEKDKNVRVDNFTNYSPSKSI